MVSISEQFTLENIIVPVLVAIVTTLLVEYFAKPWLEARKERLVRNRKQIDEVIFKFQKVSSSLTAILPDNQMHPLKNRHNNLMLANAKDGLYGILEALSRLPARYVDKHYRHIGMTMQFIGYLIAQIEMTNENQKYRPASGVPTDHLKEIAADLEHFDVYFLANISTQDSQENIIRRLFWNRFSKKQSTRELDKVMKKYRLSSSNSEKGKVSHDN